MAGVRGRSGGANRLSPAAHRRRGTYRPSRHAPQGDPTSGQRPEPPADLAGAALEAWHRIVARLEAAGILHATDDLVIAAYARLSATVERWQREVDALPSSYTEAPSGRSYGHPAVGTLKQYRLAERAFLAELGLTPRSRIAPEELPDPEDPFEEFERNE